MNWPQSRKTQQALCRLSQLVGGRADEELFVLPDGLLTLSRLRSLESRGLLCLKAWANERWTVVLTEVGSAAAAEMLELGLDQQRDISDGDVLVSNHSAVRVRVSDVKRHYTGLWATFCVIRKDGKPDRRWGRWSGRIGPGWDKE